MDVIHFVAVLLTTNHFSEGVVIYLWPTNERGIEGFVEVYYNGSWGFVGNPDVRFTDSTASVLCKTLELSEFGYGSSYTSMEDYTGHSWLNGLECIGTETDIEQCIGENEFQYREYSNSLGWEYNYGSRLYCVDSRLKDGLSQSAGVIQTAFFGQIHTICYDGFDMNAANVLCNHLNYNGALHFTWAAPDTTPIFHSQLLCTGNEYSLTECNVSDEEIVNCSHVVNVSCGAVRFTNLNEYDDEGVVEVHYNGSWGLVGDPVFSFDDVTASYLCEKIGFTNSKNGSFSTSAHPLLTYNRKAWLDSLLCNGHETHIGECDHSGYYLVPPIMHTYKSGTWLYCFDFDVTNVRLVNGARSYEGRVELEISGRWGSICTFVMDSTDEENVGDIVCRQLGYEGLETLLEDNVGDSSYVFWMSDIYCMGNESSVTECTYTKGPSASCIDVPVYLAVQCINFDVTNVRLVNGSRSYEGRVELEINGRWGPICTFYMYYADQENVGDIVCRKLGYEGLEKLLLETVGDSSNVLWMPDIYCMGNESSVAECTYYKGPSAPCIHYPFYLTVQCIDTNDCAPSPCVNGGSCEDRVNGYKCYCVSGFEGVNCQIDIDECQSQPCSSNGNCLDDVNGYTCECTQGYEGDRCQIEDESNNSLMVILVSASGGVVVIITLIGFCWCRHRRRKRNNSKTKEVSPGASQDHARPNTYVMPKDAKSDGYTNSVKENDGTDGIEVYAEIEDGELNDYLKPVSLVGPKKDEFGYITFGNDENGTVRYHSLQDRKNDEYTHISNSSATTSGKT